MAIILCHKTLNRDLNFLIYDLYNKENVQLLICIKIYFEFSNETHSLTLWSE